MGHHGVRARVESLPFWLAILAMTFSTALAVVLPAAAVDHPVAGDTLVLRDPVNPNQRVVNFRAAMDLAIVPSLANDPRVLGATLEIEGSGAGSGDTGQLALDASFWKGKGNPAGSKGFEYFNPEPTNGVRFVGFKPGPKGGSLVVRGRGASWPYAITQPQGAINLRLTIGGEIYCAQFSVFVKNEIGRVVAKKALGPGSCAQVCGNSIAEGSEECDDGNLSGGDGCSAACQLESVNPALCAGVPSVSGTALDSVLVAGGYEAPVHVAAPRLDPSRIFIVEQPGRIQIVKNGVPLGAPFLAIEGIVQYGGEQGLLSVAFHPDYETNGRFFVYYVDNAGDVVIARYEVSGGNPDDANEASAHVVLTVPHPAFSNHNGGQLTFGPDGFLYAATGDGGFAGDPSDNSQNDSSQLGKLLRIDTSNDAVFTWAKGLRNPFRFSFDRLNGDIYIGDVGQGRWEEINCAAANPSGVNYGWDDMEGRHCFEPSVGCLTAGRTLPVLEYCNSAFSDPACSTFQAEKGQAVTGGFVYRGCAMPDLRGRYFYSDFYTAFIRSFMGVSGGNAQSLQNHTADLDPPGSLAINNVSSFGEDARGELYIVDYDGEIFRIVPGS